MMEAETRSPAPTGIGNGADIDMLTCKFDIPQHTPSLRERQAVRIVLRAPHLSWSTARLIAELAYGGRAA